MIKFEVEKGVELIVYTAEEEDVANAGVAPNSVIQVFCGENNTYAMLKFVDDSEKDNDAFEFVGETVSTFMTKFSHPHAVILAEYDSVVVLEGVKSRIFKDKVPD
jgi:hypothetical protein